MQKVGLIARRVSTLVKLCVITDAQLRIVAGRKAHRSKPPRMLETDAELDLAVAQHIGIGCAPRRVLSEKVREDPVTVLAREVDPVQRDSKHAGDGTRVLEVLGGRTVAVVVFPVRHEKPVHFMVALDQPQRRDGGVHPT